MKIQSKLLVLVLLFSFCLGTTAVTLANDPQQQAQFVSPKLLVNTSFLNVRTGPGIQYTVLLTVVGGTELPVVGRAKDNVWYQVSTVVGIGWVNVEFTARRGNFDIVPVVTLEQVIAAAAQATPVTLGLNDLGQGGGGGAPTTDTPILGSPIRFTLANGSAVTVSPGERYRAVINVEAVNARIQPADGASAITTLFRNDAFDYTIVGSTNDKNGVNWVAVDVPDIGIGWVEGAKLFIRLSRVSGQVLTIKGNAIAMRDLPGGGNAQLPILNEGREGFLIDISKDSQFVRIELGDGTKGWVPFNATVGRTGTPTDEIDLTNLQSMASDLGQGGGAVPSGSAPVAFGLATPHIIINTGFLNVRSGPGSQFGILATYPGGSELPVLGIAKDGIWFLVEGPFGQGWVNSDFAVFRGSIKSVPIINTTGN